MIILITSDNKITHLTELCIHTFNVCECDHSNLSLLFAVASPADKKRRYSRFQYSYPKYENIYLFVLIIDIFIDCSIRIRWFKRQTSNALSRKVVARTHVRNLVKWLCGRFAAFSVLAQCWMLSTWLGKIFFIFMRIERVILCIYWSAQNWVRKVAFENSRDSKLLHDYFIRLDLHYPVKIVFDSIN